MVRGTAFSVSVHNSLVCRYQGIGDPWHEYGYMLGGPIVLSYLHWILRRAKVSQVDHLAFVGRDGWILRKMYEKFFRLGNPSSSYVYLSRSISLLATLNHNGSSSYMEYILKNASKEGVEGICASETKEENLKLMRLLRDQLLAWSRERRKELEFHLTKNVGDIDSLAFVDLTTKWLTSFSAAHSIFQKKNVNNFALCFFGDLSEVEVGKLPFEAALGPESEMSVFNIDLNRKINVVALLESIVSSPENRVVGFCDGEPIFAEDGANYYYDSIAKGIEEYIFDFASNYSLREEYVLPVRDAFNLFLQFAKNIDVHDLGVLSSLKKSAKIDNKSDAETVI